MKYYDSVVPYLKTILTGASAKEHRTLRAKALECLSLVVRARAHTHAAAHTCARTHTRTQRHRTLRAKALEPVHRRPGAHRRGATWRGCAARLRAGHGCGQESASAAASLHGVGAHR